MELQVGTKVYYDVLKRNLIVACKTSSHSDICTDPNKYTCIDPNVSMNKDRLGVFTCDIGNLTIGWR